MQLVNVSVGPWKIRLKNVFSGSKQELRSPAESKGILEWCKDNSDSVLGSLKLFFTKQLIKRKRYLNRTKVFYTILTQVRNKTRWLVSFSRITKRLVTVAVVPWSLDIFWQYALQDFHGRVIKLFRNMSYLKTNFGYCDLAHVSETSGAAHLYLAALRPWYGSLIILKTVFSRLEI